MTQQPPYSQTVQQPSQYPTRSPSYGSPSSMGWSQGPPGGQPYGQQPTTQFSDPTSGSSQWVTDTSAGGTSAGGQSTGPRFADIPQDVQHAISSLDALESVAQWAKGQAERRGSGHVASRCDDLAELAHVQKSFLLRQSTATGAVGQATQAGLEQLIQELGQQQPDPSVGELLTTAEQALRATSQALGRLQATGQRGQFQR